MTAFLSQKRFCGLNDTKIAYFIGLMHLGLLVVMHNLRGLIMDYKYKVQSHAYQ